MIVRREGRVVSSDVDGPTSAAQVRGPRDLVKRQDKYS